LSPNYSSDSTLIQPKYELRAHNYRWLNNRGEFFVELMLSLRIILPAGNFNTKLKLLCHRTKNRLISDDFIVAPNELSFARVLRMYFVLES
jgi:hypothetical protein